MDRAPTGAWAECHSSRWIQKELFIVWLKNFIQYSGAKISSPVLPILDGHKSHTKSIELNEIFKKQTYAQLIEMFFPKQTFWQQQLILI